MEQVTRQAGIEGGIRHSVQRFASCHELLGPNDGFSERKFVGSATKVAILLHISCGMLRALDGKVRIGVGHSRTLAHARGCFHRRIDGDYFVVLCAMALSLGHRFPAL